jgi:hypothetical protein
MLVGREQHTESSIQIVECSLQMAEAASQRACGITEAQDQSFEPYRLIRMMMLCFCFEPFRRCVTILCQDKPIRFQKPYRFVLVATFFCRTALFLTKEYIPDLSFTLSALSFQNFLATSQRFCRQALSLTGS